MSTESLERMVSTLFTAPGLAAVETEKAYRQIWINWLSGVLKLIPASGIGKEAVQTALAQHLKLAPVMKFSGRMEMGLTMRIASLSEHSGSISLGVGAIGVSGAFGFMGRSSEESVMQVRAEYTLTNDEVSLEKYLGNWNIPLATPDDVNSAIEKLKGFED